VAGRPVPDGYTYDTTEKELHIDPVRAPVIEHAFELANEGLAMGAIARRLNQEGHRTKRGNPWTGETVKDTLSNPVYAGRVAINRDTDGKEVCEGIHEALIDAETFDRLGVKNVLRGPGRAGRPSSSTLLSGLAVCDRCGGRMWGRTDPHGHKDGMRRRSYLCRNRKAGAWISPASTPTSSTKP
jgi:site-specific DNA recombinase